VTGAGVNPSNQAAPVQPSGSGYDSRIGGGSAGADSIRISGASSALASLATDRTARIQQLTAQVRAGTYNVPSSQISQAMVAHATSLVGADA
jgi:anti-sigma28 factor (negative regulator of flagellin synthesis)